jgi:Spy/CpxP family protein refolding chaperone
VKRNWLLYLVIFSLALNFGTIGTFAYLRYQDKKQRLTWEMPPPLPLRDLWQTLKLDDGQRRALHDLVPEHRARVAAIRKDLFQKRHEFFEVLKSEAPDQAAIRAKIGEISDLQGKLEEELARFLLAVRKNLRPEQNAAFLDLVRSRLDRALGRPFGPMGGWHGPWRGGPGLGPPPPPGPGMSGPGKEPAPGPAGPGRPD